MARTAQQIFMEQVGGFVATISQLTADMEAVREELAALKAAAPKAPDA